MPTLIVGRLAAKACQMLHALGKFVYTDRVKKVDEDVVVFFDSNPKYAAWIKDGMPPHPDANDWIKEGLLAFAILSIETERLVDPGKPLDTDHVAIIYFEVPPAHQSKGVGTEVVLQLLTLLKTLKVTRVNLSSLQSARGFWRKLGFQIEQGKEINLELYLQTQPFPAPGKPDILTSTGLKILMEDDAADAMNKRLPDSLDRRGKGFEYANDVLKRRKGVIAWMEGKNLVAYAAISLPAEQLMDPSVKTTTDPSVKTAMDLIYFEVVPSKQRQGFGKAIIDDLLERAKTKVDSISVKAWSGSKAFWVGRGWVGEERNKLIYHFT